MTVIGWDSEHKRPTPRWVRAAEWAWYRIRRFVAWLTPYQPDHGTYWRVRVHVNRELVRQTDWTTPFHAWADKLDAEAMGRKLPDDLVTADIEVRNVVNDTPPWSTEGRTGDSDA